MTERVAGWIPFAPTVGYGSPLWWQEAEEPAQMPSRRTDRHRISFLVALVHQAVSMVAYQVTIVPLRVRNPTSGSQAIEKVQGVRLGLPACFPEFPGSAF